MPTLLTATQLELHLSNGAVLTDPQGGVMVSLSALAGVPITMNDSIVLPLKKLLEGCTKLTSAINTERSAHTPTLNAIDFVAETVTAIGGIPTVSYTADFAVNTALVDPAVIDPTV